MTYSICYFLVLGLLQIQIKSQNRFCQEAVSSMRIVTTCPTSKTEWDSAALKKNCDELAQRQNCVSFNKFKYHCVINGLRNTLVEVCAPERIIFGHCVEFNVRGGVIQDQKSALCNRTFPKCDRYYYSTNAYKYPDCYMLVSKGEAIWLTTKDTSAKLTTMRTITDEPLSSPTSIAIIAAILIVGLIASLVLLSLKIRKRRMRSGMRVDESKEAMLEDINIQHDNADDDEMVEKEDDEEMVEKDDDEAIVEKEDDEEIVEKEDDEEMVEKEDELRVLLYSSDLRTISYLKRRFSVNESSTCKNQYMNMSSIFKRPLSMMEFSNKISPYITRQHSSDTFLIPSVKDFETRCNSHRHRRNCSAMF